MDAGVETCSEIVLEQQCSVDEVASLAKVSESSSSLGEAFAEFSLFMGKLSPLLDEMRENKMMDKAAVYKAIESLEAEFYRAKMLLSSTGSHSSPLRQIEEVTQNLGRSLGLVLFASHEVSMANKEKIEALRKELMTTRFDSISERESEFSNDLETEEISEQEIVEEGRTSLEAKDVIFQLNCGGDEEFTWALMELDGLIRDNIITNEMVDDENIASILCKRLCSSKSSNRIAIIRILRSLIQKNDENKVM